MLSDCCYAVKCLWGSQHLIMPLISAGHSHQYIDTSNVGSHRYIDIYLQQLKIINWYPWQLFFKQRCTNDLNLERMDQ